MIPNAQAPPASELAPRPDGVVVCRVQGEIDLEANSYIRDVFAQAARHATAGIVIDCHALEFCDSTLLNALLCLRRTACAHHQRLVLAAPPAQLQRLLELTGTTELLPAYTSLATALDHAAHPGEPDAGPLRP
ncbi:anti-sigma factor antagonist [Streptomyces sp. WAC07061]|uniref:STAS domain-containing protein n=1 Tax=Streptomyces sp. WAC07061 TaxID=2487410 RepID=UPI000F7A34FD|nr:STAS domain-containing protein [Streptomyces sp. WAC07061]RSS40121.1 anti-sigma factor antagonist [Streptomyces sp. WAC07061]